MISPFSESPLNVPFDTFYETLVDNNYREPSTLINPLIHLENYQFHLANL